MDAINDRVLVEVIMSADYHVDEGATGILCELDVVWLTGVCYSNDDFSSVLSQLRYKLFRGCGGLLIYQIRW